MLVVALAVVGLGANADASVIHEFGSGLSSVSEDVFFSEAAGSEVSGELVWNVIGETVGTQTFDYTLTITPGSGVAALTFSGNNMGQDGSTNNQFDPGDVITITVSGISNSNVLFDGLVGLGTNFNGGSNGYEVGGLTYIQGSGGTGTGDPRNGAAPEAIVAGPSIDVTFITIGTATLVGNLRGVALQFSENLIPEPASAILLLGLTAPALVRRRKR